MFLFSCQLIAKFCCFISQPSVVDGLLIVDVAPCESIAGTSYIEEYMTTLMKIEFDNSLSLSQTRRNVANQMIEIIPVSMMSFYFIFFSRQL